MDQDAGIDEMEAGDKTVGLRYSSHLTKHPENHH